MGFMDKLSGMFGGDKAAATETVKGPSTVLREQGIDPSDLKFAFNQDGTIVVTGQCASQSESDRICEVIEGIPNVSGVQNNMMIGAPEPQAPPVTEAAPEVVVEEAVETGTADSGRTYTVKSGDTLWAIAENMYGSGGKYMKIFEANTSILENPDKIFPGQELAIPDLDD